MTKQKATKRALLMSFLSILLCVSMLIGTTYAWFTDSVTSSGNIIKSGTLDVEMYWAEGEKDVPAEDSADWKDASTTKIFDYDKWEPGYVAVRHIKIANEGTLALKYQLAIVADGEVSELADVIDVYFVDPAAKVADRTALTDANKVDTLTNVLAGMPANMSGELLEDEYATVTIALKMQEEAGNKYQDKSIGATFAVQLLATQLTAEKDSFDDQYDKDAWHPDFTVTSAEELTTALANGGKIQVNGMINADGTITVPWNTNRQTEFVIDAETVNALKGGTYVLDDEANWGFTVTVDAGETLALSNMDITADSAWVMNMLNQGGTLTLSNIDLVATDGAGVYAYGANGTTTLNNLNVNHVNLSDPSAPWAATAVATSNGHNLIINGGTYVGSTYGVFVYNSGGKVTINGGTFKAPNVLAADGSYTDQSIRGELYVNGGNFDGKINMTNGYAYCEITGGNFTNFSVSTYSPVVITGGTFDADPSAYVANGYQAVDNGDGTWTVKSSAVVITEALVQGGNVNLTSDTALSESIITDKEVSVDLNQKTLSIDQIEIQNNATFSNGTVRFDTMFGKLDIRPANGNDVEITFEDVKFDNVRSHSNAVGSGIGNLTDNVITTYTRGNGSEITLVFKNCTFNNSGADFNYKDKVDATFENCNFNCTVTNNNIITFAARESKLTVKDCKFNVTSNYANCTVISGNYYSTFDIQGNTAIMNGQSGGNYYFLGNTDRGASANPNVTYASNNCTGFRNANGR